MRALCPAPRASLWEPPRASADTPSPPGCGPQTGACFAWAIRWFQKQDTHRHFHFTRTHPYVRQGTTPGQKRQTEASRSRVLGPWHVPRAGPAETTAAPTDQGLHPTSCFHPDSRWPGTCHPSHVGWGTELSPTQSPQQPKQKPRLSPRQCPRWAPGAEAVAGDSGMRRRKLPPAAGERGEPSGERGQSTRTPRCPLRCSREEIANQTSI